MATKKITKRQVSEIETVIARLWDCRQNVIVPNVSFGLFPTHEADLLVMSKSGYLTEFEIKRSWSDFLNDFKKESTHDEGKVSVKYFVLPIAIKEKSIEYLDSGVDPEKTWGVITYDENLILNTVRVPSNINKRNPDFKLTLEEQYRLARLGAMRVWNLKEKLNKILKENVEN